MLNKYILTIFYLFTTMATALPLANAFVRSDSGTGKVWIQQGRVIEIDDVGNVS
jgi:hypothetical protein